MMRFAVVGLPRSGTTWAANWLTSDGVLCLHDPIATHAPATLPGLDLGRPFGVSCSGLWAWPDVLRDLEAAGVPVLRLVRDPVESNAELCALGLPALPDWLQSRFDRGPGLSVPFADLWNEAGARRIWSYLRPGVRFDVERWAMLRDIQVQPILARMTICQETDEAVTRIFHEEGKHHG